MTDDHAGAIPGLNKKHEHYIMILGAVAGILGLLFLIESSRGASGAATPAQTAATTTTASADPASALLAAILNAGAASSDGSSADGQFSIWADDFNQRLQGLENTIAKQQAPPDAPPFTMDNPGPGKSYGPSPPNPIDPNDPNLNQGGGQTSGPVGTVVNSGLGTYGSTGNTDPTGPTQSGSNDPSQYGSTGSSDPYGPSQGLDAGMGDPNHPAGNGVSGGFGHSRGGR